MYSKENNKITHLIFPAATFVVFISMWMVLDSFFGIRNIILPNPLEIATVVINNFSYLIEHTLVTVIESLSGFLLGSFLGIVCGVFFTFSKILKKSFYPYAIAFKAVPVIALAPLLIVWFGSGMLSKIVMASIICYFPVLVGTVKGLSAITQGQLDLFKSLSASKWQIFWKMRIPMSFPYIFPSLKIAATFSVVGATIAEFTGAAKGIGYIIVNSSYYLETTMMFGAILMISIAGLIFFYLVQYLEQRILFWQVEE